MTALSVVGPDLGAALSAYGLRGSEHALPTGPFDAAQWRQLLAAAEAARATGLLLTAAEDGAVALDEEQHRALVAAHVDRMAAVVALEDLLLSTLETLEQAGVEVRVLKGSATAHLDHAAPEHRVYGDIDLLVRSCDFDDAVTALLAAGNRRHYFPPRPGFERRFAKCATLLAPSRYEIDLHRTLVAGPAGLRIRLDDLWTDSETFTVAGRTLHALSPTGRLLSACYSAEIGDSTPPLWAQRDIVQLALDPRVNGREVRRVAARWGGEAIVAAAVAQAWRRLRIGDITALSAWALRYHPTHEQEAELAFYRRSGLSETARSLAAVRAIPRQRDRAYFLLALAFPSKEYLARTKHDGGLPRRVVRGLGELRRTARR